jgi:hypothetical protein
LPDHDEEQIRALLDHAPLSVSIAAKFLNGYHSGIINCTADGIDHAVLLVGYGVENGTAVRSPRSNAPTPAAAHLAGVARPARRPRHHARARLRV